MAAPELLKLASLAIYQGYFNATYCLKPLVTHDGISVRFRKSDFNHRAYENSNRYGYKDPFSQQRAERLGWIRAALQDPNLVLYAGWDKDKRRYFHDKRVTIMIDDFVVVIRLKSATEATFVTCYVADNPDTKAKILSSPKWISPFV
jgi:hypothetical protein